MGKVVEFPLWLAQRSPPAEAVSAAQIIIFPSVHKEARIVAAERLLPVPVRAAGALDEERER